MKKLFVSGLLVCAGFFAAAQTADQFFKSASVLAEKGNFEDALVKLNKTIELSPAFAQAYVYRGTCEYYLGNPEGAAINWLKAKSLGLAAVDKIIAAYVWPEFDRLRSAQEYLEDGNKKLDAGDHYGAIIDYTNAVYIEPNYSWGYNKRAYAKTKIKLFSEAIKDYDKALKLNPSDFWIYTFRGMAKYAAGNKDGACADVSEGVKLGHEKFRYVLKEFGCE